MPKGADIVTMDETRKVLGYLRECFPRKFESKSTAAEKKRMMNSILKQWQKLFAIQFPGSDGRGGVVRRRVRWKIFS